jgi:hypothetical protein
MVNPLGIVMLAGIGLALAVQHVRRQESATPAPPDQSSGQPPAGIGEPGAEEPEPEDIPAPIPDPYIDHERLLELPPRIQDINLSGKEEFKYMGEGDIADRPFKRWKIYHSLNDLTISVYVQTDNPKNYLGLLEIPPNPDVGSPASVDMLYLSGETQADRDWFATNIVGVREGTWPANV